MGRHNEAIHQKLDEDQCYHIRDTEINGETVGIYLRLPAISEVEALDGDTETVLNRLIDLIQFKAEGDDEFEPFEPVRDGERIDPLKVLVGLGIAAGEVLPAAMSHWQLDAAGKEPDSAI